MNRSQWCSALVAVCVLSGPLMAQDGLSTMDEALAASKKTGRPILAIAGRKT